MPKVRASSATIGTMRGPERAVAQQRRQHAHQRHRGRHLLAVGAEREGRVRLERGHRERRGATAGATAGSRRAPRGARAGRPSRGCPRRACRKRSAARSASESGRSKRLRNSRSASTSTFFCWCDDHPRLAGAAHAVALLGLGEDHGRLAAMRARGGERRVELAEIVAAAAQRVDLLRRHVRDQRLQLGRELEEVLLVVGAVVGAERLVLAVDGRRELAQQRVRRRRARTAGPSRSPTAP